MANHPNRGPIRTAASTPTTVEIRDARIAADVTQAQAADYVRTSIRAWQQWEAGDRRMHPAFFELFQLKAGLIEINPTLRALRV